jgi:hypothetical protein
LYGNEYRRWCVESDIFGENRRNAYRGIVCPDTITNYLGEKEMKKVLFVLLLVAAVGIIGCVQAEEAEAGHRRRRTVTIEENHNVGGVLVDAPNLVKIGKGWTLGAEGGKEIIKNLFYNDNAFFEADKGYFAFVKFTYSGCLLNCEE